MAVWGGLDGCRGGWVLAVLADGPPPARPHVRAVEVHRSFAGAMDRLRAAGCRAAGVDIPIGIPLDGSRVAEGQARRLLGPRRSSVFSTPARPVLSARDYPEALQRSREATGKGVSRQAWNLVPKIVEVDRWMATQPPRETEAWVFEVHPELAFARLAGAPLPEPKRSAAGHARRRALLAGAVAQDEEGIDGFVRAGRAARAGPDDVLDALAVACSARGSGGGPLTTLGDGGRDERGLVMRISF